MILGVYWYFGFPEGLYVYDLFAFVKGQGGFADWPASLTTHVVSENPQATVEQLQALIVKYKDGFLTIHRDEKYLKISTGGYQMFDYDFLLIGEVENILKNNKVELSKNRDMRNANPITLGNPDRVRFVIPRKGFLQMVGSPKRKCNAETSSLRMDCNVSFGDKEDFINALDDVARSEYIDVLYYFDTDFGNRTNLMLFFTNGRQGVNLSDKKYTDVLSFENKIEQVNKRYNAVIGHVAGMSLYPASGPKVKRMIDNEFIIE